MEEYHIIKSSYEYTKIEYEKMNEENQILRERLRQMGEEGNQSHEQNKLRYRER